MFMDYEAAELWEFPLYFIVLYLCSIQSISSLYSVLITNKNHKRVVVGTKSANRCLRFSVDQRDAYCACVRHCGGDPEASGSSAENE